MLRKIAETIVPSQTSLENTGILNLVLPGTFNWQLSLFICKQVQFFENVVKSHSLSHKDLLALLETFVTH